MQKNQFSVLFLMMAVILPTAITFSSHVNALTSTFGHINVGESSKTTFGGMFVTNFTSPSNLGNITQIDVYLATGGTSAKAVIYSDNNGVPSVLLAQSASVDVAGTSGRWVSFDIAYPGTPDTNYWLGFVVSSAGTYYYSSNVNGKAIYSAPVADPTNTFMEATASPGDDLSIYAIYTPLTSSVPQPENQGWIQLILLLVLAVSFIFALIVAVVIISKRRKK